MKSDGWNLDQMSDLESVLDDIYDLTYELKNCVRGAYTGCHTYDQLSDYIKGLGERLAAEGDAITDFMQDEYEEDE